MKEDFIKYLKLGKRLNYVFTLLMIGALIFYYYKTTNLASILVFIMLVAITFMLNKKYSDYQKEAEAINEDNAVLLVAESNGNIVKCAKHKITLKKAFFKTSTDVEITYKSKKNRSVTQVINLSVAGIYTLSVLNDKIVTTLIIEE